jgi:hypothetical protein
VDAGTQVGVDALEVRGMDGQSILVLLAGMRDDAEFEVVHDASLSTFFGVGA